MNGAVPAPGGSNRKVSARRGPPRVPQYPVPPEGLGPEAALARREPGKLPDQQNRPDSCSTASVRKLSIRTDFVRTQNITCGTLPWRIARSD